MIARGIFTSVTDLRRTLMRYIKQLQQDREAVSVVLRGPNEAHRMITGHIVRTVHQWARKRPRQAASSKGD